MDANGRTRLITDAAAGRRLRIRLAAATATAVIAFALALFVGPRLPDDAIAKEHAYFTNVRFTPIFGVSLNRDFIYYLAAAQHPARLLEPDVLQSRPLLPVLLSPLLEGRDPRSADGSISFTLAEATRGILAYALANLLLVLAGLAFARRYGSQALQVTDMTRAQAIAAEVALAAGVLMLLFNALGSSFLLQPHAQMFTIVAAGAVTAWAHQLCSAGRVSTQSLILAGLAFGIAMLGYGAFAMTPGVLVLCLLFRRWRRMPAPPRIGVVSFVVLVFLPLASYAAWVLALTGTFYNHEVVRFRQVVWIADVLQENGFPAVLARWFDNLWFFLRHGAAIALPALALPIVAGLVAGKEFRAGATTWTHRGLPAAAIVSFAAWMFFALVGMNERRLAYAVALPLVAGFALLAAMIIGGIDGQPRRRAATAGVMLVVLAAATVAITQKSMLL